MKIESRQGGALEQAARRDFHQRLCRFLREEMPDATAAMDDVSLHKYIEARHSVATRYGLHTEAAVAQFVSLSFATEMPLEEIPEVRSILELCANSDPATAEEYFAEVVECLSLLNPTP